MRGVIMVDPSFQGEVTLEIKNTQPIELLDLTTSLAALGNEYLRHLEYEHHDASASEVRLYVNEVKSGSVIATLMAASPQMIEIGTHALSVISFAEKLKKAYDFLTGLNKAKPKDLDKKSLQNLASIVEPIAKDSGSQLNIGVNNGNVFLSITSTDANAAQNAVNRLLRDDGAASTRRHDKVVLYWYQARAEATTTTGDKGVIESISEAPVKVVCVTDRLKRQMVLDVENPFREAYIVDVSVETINGKPVVYRVLELHEKIPRES
jgi:hypothetical protein